jgi:hypothetical protein
MLRPVFSADKIAARPSHSSDYASLLSEDDWKYRPGLPTPEVPRRKALHDENPETKAHSLSLD